MAGYELIQLSWGLKPAIVVSGPGLALFPTTNSPRGHASIHFGGRDPMQLAIAFARRPVLSQMLQGSRWSNVLDAFEVMSNGERSGFFSLDWISASENYVEKM